MSVIIVFKKRGKRKKKGYKLNEVVKRKRVIY